MAKKYEVIVHNKTPAQVGDLLTSVNRLDNPMLKIFGLASTSKLLVKLEDDGFRIQSRLFFQHMSPVYVLASTQAVDKGTQLKFRLGLSGEGRQSLCVFGLLYYCLALYATFIVLTSSSFYDEQNRWCLIVFPFLILVVLPAVLSLGFLVPQYLQRRELEKEAFGFLKNTFPGLKEVSEKSTGWRWPEFAEKQPVVGGAWLMKPTPWRERFVRHHCKLRAVTKAVSRACNWLSNTLSCPEMETLDAPSVEMELAIPQSQLMFRLSRQQSDEGLALGVFDKRKFHIVFKNHQFVVRRKRLLTSPIAKLLLHFLDLETGQQLTGKTTPVLAGTHLKLTWSQHPVVSPSPLIIILPMLVLLASVEVGALILFVAVLIYGLMITSRVQQKAEQYEILQFLCESVGECGNDANLLQKKPLVIPLRINC